MAGMHFELNYKLCLSNVLESDCKSKVLMQQLRINTVSAVKINTL